MRAALVDHRGDILLRRSAATPGRCRRAGGPHRPHPRRRRRTTHTARPPMRWSACPGAVDYERGTAAVGTASARRNGPTSCRRASSRPASVSGPTSPTTPTWRPWARPRSAPARGSPTSPTSPSRRASAPAWSTVVDCCGAAGRWPRWATPSSTGEPWREGLPSTLEELGSGSGLARMAREAGPRAPRRPGGRSGGGSRRGQGDRHLGGRHRRLRRRGVQPGHGLLPERGRHRRRAGPRVRRSSVRSRAR